MNYENPGPFWYLEALYTFSSHKEAKGFQLKLLIPPRHVFCWPAGTHAPHFGKALLRTCSSEGPQDFSGLSRGSGTTRSFCSFHPSNLKSLTYSITSLFCSGMLRKTSHNQRGIKVTTNACL